MPRYEIWLQNDRKAEVEGDAIEPVPAGAPRDNSDAKYAPYGPGDLLVWRGGQVVAWYKREVVAGYNVAERSARTLETYSADFRV